MGSHDLMLIWLVPSRPRRVYLKPIREFAGIKREDLVRASYTWRVKLQRGEITRDTFVTARIAP